MTPFRWGIVGTGFVARKFVLGLRAIEGARAELVVSRKADRAQSFAKVLGIPRVVASYEEAMRADGIDAVYIATPPATHRDLALMGIAQGKPLLVEKPFALNAAEARDLAAAARAKSVLCVEGMWTRFLPLIGEVKRMIAAGELGEIRMMTGSFGLPEAFSPTNFRFSATEGGGALLDRGVYPISLAQAFLGPPASVSGHAVMAETGVDEQNTIILRWPSGALGTFQSSLRAQMANDFLIQGTDAQIQIEAPLYRPSRMSIQSAPRAAAPEGALPNPTVEALKESHWVHQLHQRAGRLRGLMSRGVITRPYAGNGYGHEAEHVMACLKDGRTESNIMPLADSVAVMETLDALRAQWEARATAPAVKMERGAP